MKSWDMGAWLAKNTTDAGIIFAVSAVATSRRKSHDASHFRTPLPITRNSADIAAEHEMAVSASKSPSRKTHRSHMSVPNNLYC